MSAVSIEFVGGPKDGEVAMIQTSVPEIELRAEPTQQLRYANVAPAKLRPVRVIYSRRDGPPRLDGVHFYDYAGVR